MSTATATPTPRLDDVLRLDRLDDDVFRSRLVYRDEQPLYGGQLAAQALLAAGSTVDGELAPYSMHLYYLRRGDASQPAHYQVQRDRDGRTVHARRVVVTQGGDIVATVSCSFGRGAEGPDLQMSPGPAVPADLGELPPYRSPRLFGFDCRLSPGQPDTPWPTRFWARAEYTLTGDRLVDAAVIAYLSDRSSGIGGLTTTVQLVPVSLDHALWFHRPGDLSDWMHMDLMPDTLHAGRAWYRGAVHDSAGRLVASLAQEVLARPRAAAVPSRTT
jgi:acyl-CoA thioesterase-2